MQIHVETKMITKKQFERYVRVQMSGVTNMFAVNMVMELSGLSKEQCFEIMKTYGQLKELYPKVN